MSICLHFLLKTWFFDSYMVELLSRNMGIGSSSSSVRLTKSILNHTAWQVVEVASMYSASANDSDTM